MAQHARTGVLLAAAALALGACSSYGDRYGPRYSSGYYDSYYDRGYSRSYPAYYGWYNNYYYPGVGYYVYSRSGERQRWNNATRRHWEARRAYQRDRRDWRENWSGYRRDARNDRRNDRRRDRRR